MAICCLRVNSNKPPHDKTNKMTVYPAKTQISLGIRPVGSESLLSAWRKLGSLATHWAQAKTLIRLGGCPGWSESLQGAQSFCWFCHEAAHLSYLMTSLVSVCLFTRCALFLGCSIRYLFPRPKHSIHNAPINVFPKRVGITQEN